jgi:hypothetical protein
MTKTDTTEKTWCYFIFRVKQNAKYDVRCPDCGLCIAAVTELEAVAKAYQAANNLLQPDRDEMVVCHPVRDRVRRRQALLMHKDFVRKYAYQWN